jgi:AmiR/NasT family two-component response regulator
MLLATHAGLAVSAVMLREKAENLVAALATNRDIGVAMGILMATHKIPRQQAFDLLRIVSQHTHCKLHDIAADVAESGTLEMP